MLTEEGEPGLAITYRQVVEAVQETLIEASTCWRADQMQKYAEALAREKSEQARWVLETMIENFRVAAHRKLPLCDDTGIPHVFAEIGDGAQLPPGFFAAVEEGVVLGLRRLPGRPMAVLGDEVQRITQSAGLAEDPGALAPAPIQIRRVPGDRVKLTVLMLGGGPEIRGKTMRVFHQHSLEVVLAEMVRWAREGTAKLGCLPCVLAFGVGRTNLEAASLTLEAMKDGDCTVQSPLEQRITGAVNRSGIGPLGLGGQTTALATFVKVGPQRASGVRIISLRVGCCFDPRRASVVF
ncbi:fumarate hydratase [Clostridiales bacterium PH28_bin88]|nr:fumarate hydratase [Clostridiales bacterium PH28_bin88]